MKYLFSALILLAAAISSYAQSADFINYQAVLRDNNGVLLSEKAVSVRFSVVDGSASGAMLYQEEHNTATNEHGLINLKIGGGISISGSFKAIDWGGQHKFLQTEVRQGSGSYTDLGTQQLVSVPYALHARNTEGISGIEVANTTPSTGQVLKYNGTAWAPAADQNTNHFVLNGAGDTLRQQGARRINLGFTNARAAGLHSTVLGVNTLASADAATAMGLATVASGLNATASGYNSKAEGNESFATGSSTVASGTAAAALGVNTIASGSAATSMGAFTRATGSASMATGRSSKAEGHYSVAMGDSSTASGTSAFAMGFKATASGFRATAIGNNVTASNNGSFILGDASGQPFTNNIINGITMRFSGGYRFFTNSASTIGVYLSSGGNSWSSLSDSTKKENFRQVDGGQVLAKISTMQLGSWNYKGTDPATHRHYGPMAQEFYQHFGHDGIGTIGNDTTIATADIDGVMMIAIRELIQENQKAQQTIQQLLAANSELTEANQALTSDHKKLAAAVAGMEQTHQQTARLLADLQDRLETRAEATPTAARKK